MTPGMEAILRALTGKRVPLHNEKETQEALWAILEARSMTWKCGREVRIAGGIIDFVVGGDTGIEVKLKGQAAAIARQVKGYADEPTLTGFVIVTAKPLALGPAIKGKPVVVFDLARAWL